MTQAAIGQLKTTEESAKWKSVCWVALGVMVLLVWWAYSTELASTLASGAQTPWPMVDRWLDPELGRLDPTCHADELRQSLYMRGFLVTEWLGIDRTAALSFSMLLGFVILAMGSVALVQAFAPGAGPAAWLLFATWNLASPLPRVDLANFGGGLSPSGQMYAPALGLGLLALAAVIRRSWILFGCFVAAAALCHVAVAFYIGVIGAAMALASIRRADLPRLVVGLVIAVGVSGFWSVQVLGSLPDQMSAEDWLRHARFGNYHWFPFDLGLFGSLHTYWSGATIFLGLFLAGLVAAPLVLERRVLRSQWLLGVAAAVVLTLVGLGASLFDTTPFLVKLGMHRASSIIIQLSMLVLALHLLRMVERGGIGRWVGILIILLCTRYGLGPLLALVVFLVSIRSFPRGRRWIPWTAVVILASWLGSLWIRGHLGHWLGLLLGTSKYHGWASLQIMTISEPIVISRQLGLTLIIGTSVGLVLLAGFLDKKRLWNSSVVPLLMGVVLLLAGAHASTAAWLRIQDGATQGVDRHGDFLAAQLWARDNTAPRALFFVDPTDEYGFREYSRRPTFGTPREWIHTSFLYNGSKASFEEGLRRSSLFGVQPADFMANGPSMASYEKYRSAVREAIYARSPVWFTSLAAREGLDYLVFRAVNSGEWSDIEPLYENPSYRIYDLRSEAVVPLLDPSD